MHLVISSVRAGVGKIDRAEPKLAGAVVEHDAGDAGTDRRHVAEHHRIADLHPLPTAPVTPFLVVRAHEFLPRRRLVLVA